MKSIKRGRGPSLMDGLMGLAVGVFGVIWTLGAGVMGAGPVFVLFGILFVCIAIGQAVYSFSNATRKNRFSEYDLVSENEEADPLNARFGAEMRTECMTDEPDDAVAQSAFCPYCGAKAGNDFEYCNQCGKKLPKMNDHGNDQRSGE